MKKILTCMLLFTMLFCSGFTSIAAESKNNKEINLGGFSFDNEEIGDEFARWLTDSSGEPTFKTKKLFTTSDNNLGNEVTIEITRVSTTRATNTLNFAISGRYYFKSTDTTVSNYGIHGSADYNNSSVTNAIWDKYHDVTSKYKDTYSASSTKSSTSVTDGQKFTGKFRLKNTKSGTWCEDSEISVTVKKNGDWSSVGNYSAINID